MLALEDDDNLRSLPPPISPFHFSLDLTRSSSSNPFPFSTITNVRVLPADSVDILTCSIFLRVEPFDVYCLIDPCNHSCSLFAGFSSHASCMGVTCVAWVTISSNVFTPLSCWSLPDINLMPLIILINFPAFLDRREVHDLVTWCDKGSFRLIGVSYVTWAITYRSFLVSVTYTTLYVAH